MKKNKGSKKQKPKLPTVQAQNFSRDNMKISIENLQASVPAELTSESRGFLSNISNCRFAPRDRIYNPSMVFSGIYLIEEGISKTEILRDQAEIIVAINLPGDILGLDSFANDVYISRATSVTSISSVWIPAKTLFFLLQNSKEFSSCFAAEIGRAYSESVLTAQMLSKKSAQSRVAFLLLKLSKALTSSTSAHGAGFDPELSRSEMAAYLAIDRDTLSRKIHLFQALGYVEVRDRRIRVCNYEGLRQSALIQV